MFKNIKIFTFCNLYILLWIVYNLQSFFFGGPGTIYSRLIVLFLLAVTIYYCGYALFHYKMPLYNKGLLLLLSLLVSYGLVYMLGSVGKVRYVFLQAILISLLPVYPFYVFTRQGKLNINTLRWWIVIFFVASTIEYFQMQQHILQEKMLDEDSEMVNNVGYVFLSLLPLLAFYSKKKIIMYIGLVYSAVFILSAMKRGAIVIGGISVIWIIFFTMKESKGIRKMGTLFLSVIVFAILVISIQRMLSTSELFNARIENTIEGRTSGRNYIYKSLWNHFIYESNFLQQFFGNGAESTLSIVHIHAHNDWLEILTNQGLLGILVYMIYWVQFFKTCKYSKYDNEVFLAISLLFIIYFMKTLFSMSYNDMTLYAEVCLGYCLGMKSNREKQQVQYDKI